MAIADGVPKNHYVRNLDFSEIFEFFNFDFLSEFLKNSEKKKGGEFLKNVFKLENCFRA